MKADGEEDQPHSFDSHLADPIHCERASLLQWFLVIVTLLGSGKSFTITDDFAVQNCHFPSKMNGCYSSKPFVSQYPKPAARTVPPG